MTGSLGLSHASAAAMLTNCGLSMAGMPSFGGPPERISRYGTLCLLKSVVNSRSLAGGSSGGSSVGAGAGTAVGIATGAAAGAAVGPAVAAGGLVELVVAGIVAQPASTALTTSAPRRYTILNQFRARP